MDEATRPPTALVVGANQRSSSLALRDRLYVEEYAHAKFLEALRRDGITQALLLSTCDRIEVHAMHADPDAAGRTIAGVLARHGGFEPGDILPQLYMLEGDAALRHIFAVAASLESTVIGEPHVLGQVKASWKASRAAGLGGSAMEACMQAAIAAAKRVRTETAIGEGPVSVVAAVVELARAVHGDLDRCSALLIGTGEMGELLASGLRAAGLSRIIVTDTRQARGEVAARLLHCHLLPIEGLAEAAPRADIIVGCLGGRTPAVTVEMARSALRRRRNQPIVMIDAALPGDVDPLVDRLDGIFLYTLDDLERVARDGRKARLEAVGQARDIVEQELAAFLRQRAERAAVPALLRLRDRFESERARALADARGDAEKATRLLINRLLHDPTRRLREIAGRRAHDDDEVARIGELLVRLFTAADESDEDER
jgi:glutamyl-tRNA reductase